MLWEERDEQGSSCSSDVSYGQTLKHSLEMLTSTDGLEQEQSGDTDQDSPGIHQGGLAACAKTQHSEFRETPAWTWPGPASLLG